MQTDFTLKNGLTQAQVNAARSALSMISLKKICIELNVPMATIYNVLRDNSSRIDLLKKGLDAAYLEIEERKKILASIPDA